MASVGESIRQPRSVMLTRLTVVLCALNFAILARSVPAAEQSADVAALEAGSKLQVARNGDEVMVSWELPQGATIKGADIYRNTQERATGRTRLDFARPLPAVYLDKVPDAKTVYWYSIKVVFTDGRSITVGPVASAPVEVWTP
jgi:hypothetical protein